MGHGARPKTANARAFSTLGPENGNKTTILSQTESAKSLLRSQEISGSATWNNHISNENKDEIVECKIKSKATKQRAADFHFSKTEYKEEPDETVCMSSFRNSRMDMNKSKQYTDDKCGTESVCHMLNHFDNLALDDKTMLRGFINEDSFEDVRLLTGERHGLENHGFGQGAKSKTGKWKPSNNQNGLLSLPCGSVTGNQTTLITINANNLPPESESRFAGSMEIPGSASPKKDIAHGEQGYIVTSVAREPIAASQEEAPIYVGQRRARTYSHQEDPQSSCENISSAAPCREQRAQNQDIFYQPDSIETIVPQAYLHEGDPPGPVTQSCIPRATLKLQREYERLVSNNVSVVNPDELERLLSGTPIDWREENPSPVDDWRETFTYIMTDGEAEEAEGMFGIYSDGVRIHLGSFVCIMIIDTLAKLNQLQKDYEDGTLREKWKQWFRKNRPYVNLDSVTIEIQDCSFKHTERFLLRETLQSRILCMYCKNQNAWYWSATGQEWMNVRTISVSDGKYQGYKPREEDLKLLRKLQQKNIQPDEKTKTKICAMCVLDARHPSNENEKVENETVLTVKWCEDGYELHTDEGSPNSLKPLSEFPNFSNWWESSRQTSSGNLALLFSKGVINSAQLKTIMLETSEPSRQLQVLDFVRRGSETSYNRVLEIFKSDNSGILTELQRLRQHDDREQLAKSSCKSYTLIQPHASTAAARDNADKERPGQSILNNLKLGKGIRAEFTKPLLERGWGINSKDNQGRTVLHMACEHVDYGLVKYLISLGADVTLRDNQGHGSLWWLLQSTDIYYRTKMRIMLQELASGRPLQEWGDTHTQITRALVEAGENINTQNNQGSTALHMACYKGNYEAVTELISLGADVTLKDNEGHGSLWWLLESTINSHHRTYMDITFFGGSQSTSIEWKNTHTQMARALVANGEKINSKENKGRTLLHLACEYGNYNAVKDLISLGADVTLKDGEEHGPLWWLVEGVIEATTDGGTEHYKFSLRTDITTRFMSVAELLLDIGENVNTKDIRGRTVLHLACEHGSCQLVKVLIYLGSDVTLKDGEGHGSLWWLLEGVDTYHRANVGSMSLVWRRPFLEWTDLHTQMARALAEAGENINTQNSRGRTALHMACYGDNYRAVTELISLGADATLKDGEGHGGLWWLLESIDTSQKEKSDNELHAVPSSGPLLEWGDTHMQITRALVKAGDDINTQNSQGRTAVHMACYGGNCEAVTELISLGADVTLKDNNGHGSLWWLYEGIIKAEQVELRTRYVYFLRRIFKSTDNFKSVAKVLFDAGENINTTDIRGRSLLHLACEHSSSGVVKDLISLGADATLKDNKGHGALWWLLESIDTYHRANVGSKSLVWRRPFLEWTDLHTQMARALAEAGENINTQNSRGRTALHMACYGDNYRAVTELISLGADATLKDGEGHGGLWWLLESIDTSQKEKSDNELHAVPSSGPLLEWGDTHMQITRALVKAGDDINTQNSQGRTAVHMACYGGNCEAVTELISLGADVTLKDNNGHGSLWWLYEGIIKAEQVELRTRYVYFFRRISKSTDNFKSVAKVLLDAGENINTTDIRGRSLLHLACEHSSSGVVKDLISLGADVTLKDKWIPKRQGPRAK